MNPNRQRGTGWHGGTLARYLGRAQLGVLWLAFAMPAASAAQETGSVGGRVIDQASGEPVPGVVVTIPGLSPVLTDAEGIFIFPEVVAGGTTLEVEHIAYGTYSRQVLVEADLQLRLEVAISTQAIELSPLVVEATSELEQRRISSGNSINEVTAFEIDRGARSGQNLRQFLQGSMPGVLVRPGAGGQTCVTYRAIRSGNNRGDCDGVAVVLDGVPVADPSYIYTSIPLSDIERLEMMSPGQAGVLYGMRAGQSVLLIETKTPVVARQKDLTQLMTGMNWEGEAEPYPWLSVFGTAVVTNAIGVGIGLLLSEKCFWTPDTAAFALRTRCAGAATAGASILSVTLPAVGGSYSARWAGATNRSRGRAVPSMVLSGMVLTGGYLMLIGGDPGGHLPGGLVLGLGVPVAMTLSDRVFRVLR